MSVYEISYRDTQGVDGKRERQKICRAITTREEYLSLRSSQRQMRHLMKARGGDKRAKNNLLQMNYSCVPGDDMMLRGCQTPSNTVGMDVDFPEDDQSTPQMIEDAAQRIIGLAEQLGLMMLERSVNKGLHVVFKRHREMSQEWNLRWAADMIGCEFDENAKDITRVFYTTSADASDLLYLDDRIFEIEACEKVESTSQEMKNAIKDLPQCESAAKKRSIELQKDVEKCDSFAKKINDMERLLGGAPSVGRRNTFLFNMVQLMRNRITGDAVRIKAMLPTYGLPEREVDQIIHSALQYPAERTASVVRSSREPLDPPKMPKKLPALIELLTSRVPDLYKPAVAHAVFPALGAHLHRVNFRYVDNVNHEATLMNLLIAPTGSGKSCINEPIRCIMKDIKARDTENRKIENDWKQGNKNLGANKQKAPRPKDIPIQMVSIDLTNAALILRTREAGERFLYSMVGELDQFNSLRSPSNKNGHHQLICLAFDPENTYGAERVGYDSVSEMVTIRFNWNASATPAKAMRFFHGAMNDGPLSRINICTIPTQGPGMEMPRMGKYGEEFELELKPYIDNLNMASGHIECPAAWRLADKLVEKTAEIAAYTHNTVYDNLAHRACVIAYLKAMVLYVASGCQWDKTMEDFVTWSLHYDLHCKMMYFSSSIAEADKEIDISEYQGQNSLLEHLDTEFTLEDVERLRLDMGLKTRASALVKVWKYRGFIVEIGENMYRQTGKGI